ncbi:hypothetical protein KVR01_013621 [Diaporthe batatas]|uniref:uncharacterized protein n=1 Tax=Diaporthe batatas TaxID=748121 RepID=UPI001D04011D|nr:uncharacterized protein KVR01_013621 [Diaporthe batatas]KAG8156517.1 hypothetical protein KVR01_013621 [Diaporthe batatas]
MATIQASRLRVPVVDAAQGATNPEFFEHQSPPLNEHERKICNSQKVRSSAYTSFSCFGLYFTFITGALITVISYILEPILNCLHRRRQHNSYAHLEWISNNSLQLHRMAHEQLMGQKWDRCADDIPTTDPDVFLANLDISDPEHPILCKPGPLKVTTEAFDTSDAPEDSSSPDGGSVRSDSAADLDRPVSASSRTSVSDSSWTLDVRMTLMNVSGQLSLQGSEQDDVGGDGEDAEGDTVDVCDVASSMAGGNR